MVEKKKTRRTPSTKKTKPKKRVYKDAIDRAFEEGTPIDEALREGVREALKFHKRAGNPICEWRDGKIVWIAPEDIQIDD